MVRTLSLLIIAILCFLPSKAYPLETVQVVVLPFEIHAIKDLSYMQAEISEVIKRDLKEEGADILESGIVSGFVWREITETIEGIRKFGVNNGADYVIWGSLTWIGQKFSLDAKMIESFGEGLPGVFIKEGRGIENLLGIVKQLARDISMKLFKREKIAKVLVTGNKRIEADAIKKIIKTKPGDVYLAKSLSQDLKAVYSMGYFEDIRIEAEQGPQGKVIIFNVKEKPTIRIIRFKGNKVYDDDKIKENISIRTGSILNIFKVRSNIKRIEELYKEKNYHNVTVTYKIHQLEHNQADLEFYIQEGEKILIKHIIFEGNSAYTDKNLKKMMKTSEKGFFSWMTSSGDLNREDLDQDVAKLSAFYYNNGYIQAKVGEPQIEYKGNRIDIKIKIDEGPRFRVGKVDITGDLVLPEKELLEKLKITNETYYNREVVRNDILAITDLYSDEGYAYAEISPRIEKNIEELMVNIVYVVEKGNQVYFERIIIGGNTKTRDKVIRRELKVYEQELYSGLRLKRSVRNLYRLDFFEDIKVNTVKGSDDEKMILKIDVTEKPTGTFSFGGGYSSIENLFAMASISQRNLFGRGQVLQLKAELGGVTTRYNLSFTEPWLFDIPLSAGFNLYNWKTEYDTYDRDSIGGGVRFSYPVFDFVRAYISYAYDDADISNISESASDSIKDLEGTNITSSVTAALRYDSRDRIINPTEGSKHSISVEYAGLGGNIAFTKYLAETGWYIPLFWDTVGFLHGKTGYVRENSGGKLPDYERFYLGGMNSLRGFDWQDIHVLDEDGREIGGDKFVQFNVEYLIPLLKDVGIVAVLFYDTGNVFNNDENINLSNLRKSAGYGFRWHSPMGPMRIENGYILDAKEGESKGGRWEFSMGSAF
ncbi:MAG: outer membrane protein assembly factor BamA [Desulfobacteraceae bacterium]|nr:MAG: outer membrane protein assembly factor BamA [Desulfobacteraceae bacterium]